jgi:hypothetical protein
MDRVTLSWTIENWITVVLMAALGGLLVALAWKGIQQLPGGYGNG